MVSYYISQLVEWAFDNKEKAQITKSTRHLWDQVNTSEGLNNKKTVEEDFIDPYSPKRQTSAERIDSEMIDNLLSNKLPIKS